ncbi:hypothetical protein V6N11_028874 [Hibiscus sabdariffa]|uniref:Uncharacterized protein n=1 Tax=Hibiscus sabdariffa TaxID=183260 RepID=A0ABR1ZV14_9ROSI
MAVDGKSLALRLASAYEHLVTEEARNVGEGRVRIGGMRFAIWCWLLWKLRCSMIFDDDFSEREDLLHRGAKVNYRMERNGVADSLAAMGRLHGRSGVGFISPPDGVLSRLDSERTERLVEESFADLDSSRGRETGLGFDPGG